MNSLGGDDYVVFEAWRRGFDRFEEPLPHVYCALASEASVIFGIGANSGIYELAAAVLNPKAAIYAFEPYPPALDALRSNLNLCGCGDAIQVVPMGASDIAGVCALYIPAKTHGATLETSASLNRDFRAEHSDVIHISVTTVDDFVRKNLLPRVDILRIDVESAEHLVLEGARETLRQHRPSVFIEVLGDANVEALEALRKEACYRAFLLTPDCIIPLEKITRHKIGVNQMLLPEEHAQARCASLASTGLTIKT